MVSKPENPTTYASRSVWAFGAAASAISLFRLLADYVQFGLSPIVRNLVSWWSNTVHPPLDFLYEHILIFEWLSIHPPAWLREYHVLSIIGAAIYIRGARGASGLGLFRSMASWVADLLKILLYGLSGFGAVYLLSGFALVCRPHIYGLKYRYLFGEATEDHPLLGLFRATAGSLIGILALFALNYG